MNARAESLPVPGLLWGEYPQRMRRDRDPLARFATALAAQVTLPDDLSLLPYRQFVARVRARQKQWLAGNEHPQRHLEAMRARLAAEGLNDATLTDCFVLVSAVAARVLGLRPHDNQLLAARVLLDRRLAEMATGEGKTLVVAIAAASAALAGIPVHVMTANDYLASRDAERLAPFYKALGLEVGVVVQQTDTAERRTAYARSLTYCTAREVGFDYLRDLLANPGRRGNLHRRLAWLEERADKPQLLRGLCMALIDEADSILLDEARVPLILARSHDRARELEDLGQGMALAAGLAEGADFRLERESRAAHLTDTGRQRLALAADTLPALWRNRQHRENRVELALAALHLFHRDHDYIVRDGKVEIVDPITGRVAEGRAWSQGLHQFVELKEGCSPTQGQHPTAQITFQRLFRRYLWLAGISGTVAEARAELRAMYGLPMTRIPLHRPSRRRYLGRRLYPDRDSQWAAVVARTLNVHAGGQPVLIGTDSVAESEALAERLRAAGLQPHVLNARQDRDEARIVCMAGQRGQVMVTTNMAGRGTDIPLGKDVAALGGLHVISCQHNVDRRIDRQLAGRSARQGEPGSVVGLLTLDALLCQRRLPAWVRRRLAGGLRGPSAPLAERIGLAMIHLARLAEERQARAARRRMLGDDQKLASLLAFSGLPE